ncbi:MAG: MFS transporter [Actinobacteria bacterium]|nr:MFS transporter [Actinomycetota bacterium]
MAVRTRERLLTPPFLLIGLSALAYFAADGVLIPTVPVYVEGPLRGGDVAVGISVGAFSLSALVLRPFAGRVSDKRGRRPLMLMGAALVAVSVLGYLAAGSLPVLVAARLVTGVGEAFFFVGSATAVADLAPPDRRGEAVSLFSLSLYVGIGIGPLVGEAVLGAAGFDAVWLVSAGLAALAVALAIGVPETRPPGDREGPPPKLIHPAAVLPGLVILACVSAMSGFFAFLPLYAPQVGLSGSRFVFLTYAAVVVLIRSFGARIPDLLGARRAGRLALAGFTVGLAVLGTWRAPAGVFVGTVVSAAGGALAFPALMSLAVSGAAPSDRGAAMGTFTAFVDLGFGVGPVALGVVAATWDYGSSFLAAAAITGTGLVALQARRRRDVGIDLAAPPAPTVEAP